MRFFRLEVEIAFKAIGVIALIGLVVLPVGWGIQAATAGADLAQGGLHVPDQGSGAGDLVSGHCRRPAGPVRHTRTAWFRSRDVTVTARQSAPER